MFEVVKNKLGKKIHLFQGIDTSKIIKSVIDSDEILKAQILDLNTEDQLFNKGIDSLGRRLEDIGGSYSPYTINIKLSKGQPTDRVTLKDTGAFYDSFELKSGLTFIEITANPYKEDGKNLVNEWGGYILGLTTENKEWLANELKIRVFEQIKRELLAA